VICARLPPAACHLPLAACHQSGQDIKQMIIPFDNLVAIPEIKPYL